MKARDTTGCGDVFHGVYAVGLTRWWELRNCLVLASSAAALKATRHGGQVGIPSMSEVARFLKSLRWPSGSDLKRNGLSCDWTSD